MQIPTRVYSITFVFLYVYIVHHFSAVRKIFSPSSLNAKCKLCFYKRQNIKISVKLTIHIVNNYLFVAWVFENHMFFSVWHSALKFKYTTINPLITIYNKYFIFSFKPNVQFHLVHVQRSLLYWVSKMNEKVNCESTHYFFLAYPIVMYCEKIFWNDNRKDCI